jgi:hypothetical protein
MEELCPSHAIEVNVNVFTITEVLHQKWFRTAQLLHFDVSMLIYKLFSSSMVASCGAVELYMLFSSILGTSALTPETLNFFLFLCGSKW